MSRSDFKLSYELCPIILTNGIANEIPGQMLGITDLTQPDGANMPEDGDAFFARFDVLPGGSLIDYEIANYPFANQTVAANATIANPLRISLLMTCPATATVSFSQKSRIFAALKASLDNHGQSGGTYIVATPSYIYANCILTSLRDVSGGGDKQRQLAWQWDFEQPLLTTQQADVALNALMSKIGQGLRIDGNPAWSGLDSTVNTAPTSAVANVNQGAGFGRGNINSTMA